MRTITPKPESETDPWAKVRTFDVSTYGDCRMERDYYGEIASEQKYQRGEYAWVDEVDAARAAEAAQHQQEIAAKDKQLEQERLVNNRLRLSWREDVDEERAKLNHTRARLAAVEAERDRLKAALQDALVAVDAYLAGGPDVDRELAAASDILRAALSGEGTAK